MPQQYGVKMKKKEETKRTCVKLKTASNFHPRDPLCSVLLCNRTAAAYAKSYADILLFDSFLFLLTSILVSKCSKWVWLVHRRYLPKSHLSPSGFLLLRFGSSISSTLFLKLKDLDFYGVNMILVLFCGEFGIWGSL